MSRIDQALQRFNAQLERNKQLREQSLVMQITDRMVEHVGGVNEIGTFLGDIVMDAAKGKDGQPATVKTRREVFATMRPFLERYDDQNAVANDLSGIDKDDLNLIMVAGLIERVREDADFALIVLQEASHSMSLDNLIALREAIEERIVATPLPGLPTPIDDHSEGHDHA